MRNSKLLRLLKILEKKELKEFRDFVRSPFFNKNKKCIALYELLMPYAPAFSDPIIDDPTFTQDIYTHKASLQTLMKDLLKLVEEYFIEKELRSMNGLRKHLLLEKLRLAGEKKHFDLVYRHSLEKIKQKKKDTKTYQEEYLLEVSQLRIFYDEGEKNKPKLARQLDSTIRAFDKYVLSNHLWLDNTIFNLIRGGLTDEIAALTKDTLSNSRLFANIARQAPYYTETPIRLHLLLRRLLLRKGEKEFLELFEALKKFYSFIGNSDYNYYYKFLVNFCIQKLVQGNDNYYEQLLNVYLFAMNTSALIENEYLEPGRMRNIIVAAVKSNQLELSRNLLHQYINFVNPIYRDATKSYCLGYLHFQQKEYEPAINYFKECLNMKNLFEINSQINIFKIYYETNERWAFDIPVQSFISKLSRQKDKYTKNIIPSYLNFLRILKQIYRKREDPNYKKSFEDIRSKINSMKYISAKQWLLSQIDELNRKALKK